MQPSTTAAGGGRRAVSALVPIGRFFFKFRDFLFPAVFLLLVALSPPLRLASPAQEVALDVAGIAVALSGQLLRAVVIGLAYIRRGGKNKRIHADDLVQEGIFAHSRNPLYVGNFLALVGFTVIHNSLLCYLVGIPFFAFSYLAIVAAEEDFLGRKFGPAYEGYRRRVNRFLPSLRGLGTTLRSMRFDWKRLVRKEYGSTFAGITLVLVLLVWDRWLLRGPLEPAELTPFVAFWGGVVVLYATARILKKSGALGRG